MSGIEEGRITEARCAAFRGQLVKWVGCLRAAGADRQAIREEIVGTYWDCPQLMRCTKGEATRDPIRRGDARTGPRPERRISRLAEWNADSVPWSTRLWVCRRDASHREPFDALSRGLHR